MGESGAPANARDRLADTTLPGFRALAGQSALFATGGLAQKLAGLLLVPLLARALSPVEFGRLEVLSTMASALTGVAVLGLDVVVTRRWVDLDQQGRRRAFGTWLGIACLLGAALLGIMALAGGRISTALFGTDGPVWGVRLAGAFAAANLLQTVGLTALRNERRARAYAATSIATVLCNAALVALLVLSARDETAVMLGISLAAAIGAALSLGLTRRLVLHRPAPGEARVMLAGALRLLPGVVIMLGGDLLSRFILLSEAGPEEVGYLSIALRFTGVGILVLTGFQLAWHPRAYAIADHPEGLGRLREDASAILLLLSLVTVGLGVVSPEALRLLGGSAYGAALPTVGLALLLPLAMAILQVATLSSAIRNRMGDLGRATATAAVVSVLLTLAVADRFGAAGAAAALAGGQLAGAAVGVLLARQRGEPPVGIRRSALLLTALGAGVTVAATMPEGGASPAVRGVLLAAFGLATLAGERGSIRSALRMVARRGQEL